jgi:hypothetical protein
LADFGIRCVIAPSFGESFCGNCFRNGVLPIVLPEAKHQRIMTAASIGETLMVDLEANIVRLPGGETIEFHVDAKRQPGHGIAYLSLESPDAGKPFAADTHRQSKLGFCSCAPDAKQIMLICMRIQ